MNIKNRLMVVVTFLAVMLVALGANGTESTPRRPGDTETIDHFGRNVFFTAGCEFSDANALKEKR